MLERRNSNRNTGGRMTDDDREIVKGIFYSLIPCSTNKECLEVKNLSENVDKIVEKFDSQGKTLNRIFGGLIIALILLVANLVIAGLQ